MIGKLSRCFSFWTTSAAVDGQGSQQPALLTSYTASRNRKNRTTQSSINNVRVVTTYALASQYDNKDSGIVVLGLSTCGNPKDEGDLSSVHLVYRNISVCGIIGLRTESDDSGFLAGLAQSEPVLLRDVRAHLVRLAAADPTGSLTLYLAANKYSQAGQSRDQSSCAAITSFGFTADNAACGEDGTRPATRRWQHVIVEPVMVVASAPVATNAPCEKVSVVKYPSRFRRLGSPKHDGGDLQVPAEAHARGVGGAAFPAVVVIFAREHVQGFPSGRGEPQSSLPQTQSTAGVHGAPSPATAFPRAITAAIEKAGLSLDRSAANLNVVLGFHGAPATFTSTTIGSGAQSCHDKYIGRSPVLQRQVSTPLLSSRAAVTDRRSMPRAESSLCQQGVSEACVADSELVILEHFKPREGMVLSGLTSIATAFTCDGSAALYQNALSILYYGLRAPLRPAKDTGGAEVGAVPTSGAGGILVELFSFEPAKLHRMLADVCGAGRVWRGLVQAPVSCNPALSPLSSTQRARGEASIALVAATRQQLAAATSSLFETQPLEPQLPEQPVRRPATVPSVGAFSPPEPPLGPSPVTVASAAEACWYDSGAYLRVATSAATDRLSTVEAITYQPLTATMEGDPLATSTWGLLVDVPEPQLHLETRAGVEEATGREPQPPDGRDGGSCGSGAVASLRASTSPSLSSCPTQHPAAGPAVKPAAVWDGRRATAGDKASGNSTTAAGCPPLAVASTAGGKATASQSQRSSRSRFICSSDLVLDAGAPGMTSVDNGHQWGSLEEGPSGDEAKEQQQHPEPRAASMFGSLPFGRREKSRSALRRCISRADISSTAGVPRVLAFASSLKNTPGVLQAALQQAVTSSGRHGQNEPPVDGILSCRETFPSLPSIALYESMTSSPFFAREGRPPAVNAEAIAPLGAASENDAPIQPRPGASTKASSKASPRLAIPPAFIGIPPARQKRVSNPGTEAGEEGPGPIDSFSSVTGGDTATVPSTMMTMPPSSSTNDSLVQKRASSTVSQARSSTVSAARGHEPTVATAAAATAARSKGRAAGRRATFCITTSKPAAASKSSLVGLDDHAPLRRAASELFGSTRGNMAAGAERRAPQVVSSTAPGPGLKYCWHEVSATRSVDPLTGQHSIVVTQVDVTAKVEAERHLAFVTEAEHRLLEQVFPRHVLAYMTEEGGPWAAQVKGELGSGRKPPVRDINALATTHALVTLLFADIQGFTPMCKVLEPRVVMAFLNDLFTGFDQRLDEFGVYKVETIGDCYFVAGGLIHQDAQGMAVVRANEDQADPHHALNVFRFAQAMLEAAAQVTLPTTGEPVRMRIGIHSGPVVSGVVGQRMPRFCLFGDTVNTTSRMESSGVPGCIHASEDAWRLLRNEVWVPTGGIQVKGKGPMNTFLWAPPDSRAQAALAESIRGRAAESRPKAAGSNSNSSHAQHGAALPPVGAAAGGASSSSAAGGSGGSGLCHRAVVASRLPNSGGHASSGGGEAFDPLYSAGGFAQVWPSLAANASCGGQQEPSPNLDPSEELVGLFLSLESHT